MNRKYLAAQRKDCMKVLQKGFQSSLEEVLINGSIARVMVFLIIMVKIGMQKCIIAESPVDAG